MSPAFLSFSPGAERALITGTVLSPFGVVLELPLFDGLDALDARLEVTVVRVPLAGRTVRARVGLASRDARTDRDETGRATR